jgi:hypothetical protein
MAKAIPDGTNENMFTHCSRSCPALTRFTNSRTAPAHLPAAGDKTNSAVNVGAFAILRDQQATLLVGLVRIVARDQRLKMIVQEVMKYKPRSCTQPAKSSCVILLG